MSIRYHLLKTVVLLLTHVGADHTMVCVLFCDL